MQTIKIRFKMLIKKNQKPNTVNFVVGAKFNWALGLVFYK
jgi:hypothetical protein